MTRIPLRPLARILPARLRGENTELIERENLRRRHAQMHDAQRRRAEGRLLVVTAGFVFGFAVVGVQMFKTASVEAVEPQASVASARITADRADIVDRNGRILATNLQTASVYAQPPMMVDKPRAARELARIFPELNEEELLKQFESKRKFLWVRRKISPEQRQAVLDIGDPGLMFGPREMRLYPNGRLASHILGGYRFGREGVNSAEIIGTAGIEKYFDKELRDPEAKGPLRLSLDLTVQSAARNVLYGGMKMMNAKGASSVLMDVKTGEVISMISLPDFDPNQRPAPLTQGDQSDSPLFNRAVQGVYELGSVFKIFTMSQALEENFVTPETMVNIKGPLVWGKFKIRDFSNYGSELSATDVIAKSSNIGTARIAMEMGAERQQAFLGALGLLKSTSVELVEAEGAHPLMPEKWTELSTLTISYGHGISTSPLQLAAAYSTIVNGGTKVEPTLLRRESVAPGPRVISAETSKAAVKMLRKVVTNGTASFGEVEGYSVGGKTGTADKPKPSGGYYEGKVIATFASVFPTTDPRYVLIVTLDEPTEDSGDEPRRTAGWTSVPVAAEMIRRIAPLLGLRPEIETGPDYTLTRVSNGH